MDLIAGLVVFSVLVLLLLIRTVVNRTNRSRYEEDLVAEEEVDQAIRSRLLRYLALFGMTITSGIAFIGLLTLFFSFTTEAQSSGNFMDDVFPLILSAVAVVVGILGTTGIVGAFKKL
jgi:hypothetical protein